MSDTDPVEVGPEVIEVLVTRIDGQDDLDLPAYALPGDAGADIVSAEDHTLGPGERHTFCTGVAMALPPGYAMFVQPRSGLAARHGISIVNTPGTVDSGYRGEIKVIVVNHGDAPVRLGRGDRIAQLVFQRFAHARFTLVDELPRSDRGSHGIGSTGGHALPGSVGAGRDADH